MGRRLSPQLATKRFFLVTRTFRACSAGTFQVHQTAVLPTVVTLLYCRPWTSFISFLEVWTFWPPSPIPPHPARFPGDRRSDLSCCESGVFRFHTEGPSLHICLSSSNFFHPASCRPGPSTLLPSFVCLTQFEFTFCHLQPTGDLADFLQGS